MQKSGVVVVGEKRLLNVSLLILLLLNKNKIKIV
jgi:hypothetical protein